MKKFGVTEFVGRQWEPGFKGTKLLGITPEELIRLVNEKSERTGLIDGYAPFCKHIWLSNGTPTLAGVAVITPENQGALRTGYEARRPGELPVLGRWFEGVEPPRAEWLDVIVYSHAQLAEEAKAEADAAEAKGLPVPESDVPECEWGIVCVNAELTESGTPIAPATQLRNALGKAEGGSGTPLDEREYQRAVEFWQTHAVCR